MTDATDERAELTDAEDFDESIYDEPLTEEERYSAALALTAALPERVFTGRYDRLLGPEGVTPAAG